MQRDRPLRDPQPGRHLDLVQHRSGRALVVPPAPVGLVGHEAGVGSHELLPRLRAAHETTHHARKDSVERFSHPLVVEQVAQRVGHVWRDVPLQGAPVAVDAHVEAVEVRARQPAVVEDVALDVGGEVVGEDGLERRRALRGGEQLAHGEVGDAHHPDAAVAPGLVCDPRDRVRHVPLLLRREPGVVLPPGSGDAAGAQDHVGVAAGHGEAHHARLVVEGGRAGGLDVPGVGRPRHERRVAVRPPRPEDVGAQDDAVGHGHGNVGLLPHLVLRG